MQVPNIFGCKIFSESIFSGLSLTLHMHIPVHKYSDYPLGQVKLINPIAYGIFSFFQLWGGGFLARTPENTVRIV